MNEGTSFGFDTTRMVANPMGYRDPDLSKDPFYIPEIRIAVGAEPADSIVKISKAMISAIRCMETAAAKRRLLDLASEVSRASAEELTKIRFD